MLGSSQEPIVQLPLLVRFALIMAIFLLIPPLCRLPGPEPIAQLGRLTRQALQDPFAIGRQHRLADAQDRPTASEVTPRMERARQPLVFLHGVDQRGHDRFPEADQFPNAPVRGQVQRGRNVGQPRGARF